MRPQTANMKIMVKKVAEDIYHMFLQSMESPCCLLFYEAMWL